MAQQELTVALAQLKPALRDPQANVARMQAVIAAHPAADLVVFPELFWGGYTTTDLEALVCDVHGELFAALAERAAHHRTAVLFGAAEAVDGGFANAAFFIDRDGRPGGVYRKAQLFGDESAGFVPGDALRLVSVGGHRLGVMICFDVEFPEVARALARAGADALVTISANMTPFGFDHHLFATARAVENGLPHVYVNQVGEGERFTFTGGSMAVSVDGELSAEAGGQAEGVTVARLAPAVPSRVRPDYLALHRDPPPVSG
ncbi:nitrilase-related carbon-nitrogen hydrolase [Salinisphaera orenii]|uniref:Carbon-nitrogen hydrolase n=1 Tax=Salinisphaera orenii YIM 95161 TaxID=1051139 RepID=A0A423PJJ1_9GAMM|nr:nitrilase-related carbon-nitrogen hydrolase [Salinisphaera halophila]ROO25756.1 carbon-nitrogen hydrolase [Salinisphaera halophila YIM 95161]